MHTYIHAYIHAYNHEHTCIHTYTHTYIHTHAHTQTHTHTQSSKRDVEAHRHLSMRLLPKRCRTQDENVRLVIAVIDLRSVERQSLRELTGAPALAAAARGRGHRGASMTAGGSVTGRGTSDCRFGGPSCRLIRQIRRFMLHCATLIFARLASFCSAGQPHELHELRHPQNPLQYIQGSGFRA